MPGIHYTGILVKWDRGESNRFLYAVTDREAAITLGLGSAIEKKFQLNHYQVDGDVITIETPAALTRGQIEELPLYLYSIHPHPTEGWMKNSNLHNRLQDEYKTTKIIYSAECEPVNLKQWLHHKQLKFVHPH